MAGNARTNGECSARTHSGPEKFLQCAGNREELHAGVTSLGGTLFRTITQPDFLTMTGPSAATLPHAETMRVGWRPAAVLAALATTFERRVPHERVSAAEWAAVAAFMALAAVLRFWGLGAHGLEYDEETMAMPVMHILEHGTPVMPSGMTYVRGISQLYVMAASVMAFGPTEWALRLPSALCGVVLIVGCFLLGRRFLSRTWNLAFVGVITISSTMILDAQEARMYVFMIASLVWSSVLVFRWERTGELRALCGAVAAIVIGVQFHSLAIFGALPLLFPGLLHGDRRRFLNGLIALMIAFIGFALVHYWTESFFPPADSPTSAAPTVQPQGHVSSRIVLHYWPAALLLSVAIAACVERLRRAIPPRVIAWLPCALLSGALVAQLLVFYHLAGLLYIGTAIAVLRARVRLRSLWPVAVLSLVMLVGHVYALAGLSPVSPHKLLGQLTGVPSIWPYVIFAGYAPVVSLLVAGGAALALWRTTRRERIDAIWLYGVLALWLPLLCIGLFSWYPQQRYTELALVPLYLCGVGTLAWACRAIAARSRGMNAALAAGAALLIGNPLATAEVVNAGYRIHPDHKGAAEYVRSVRQPDDIVVAEDVLQQTYYLGRVDYWVIGERTADMFTRRHGDRLLDIYTHTPVITDAKALRAVIAAPRRGTIFIIGSGEGQGDGRKQARGRSLAPLFAQPAWPEVYRGRDGVTRVWSIAPTPAPATAP